MPVRKTVLATGEIYHIFNRSLRHTPLFNDKREYDLFLNALAYYLQAIPPAKFSLFRKQSQKYPLDLSKTLVKVLAYCVMPNHFHLLLKQNEENGIRVFLHRLTSSYGRYFNIKYDQKGPVFESRFKAVRMENDEQLIHVSRYIHLNPVTSYLVKDPRGYPYSSYKTYLGEERSKFVDPSEIMNGISFGGYEKFVLDQKDYQRELKKIEHVLLEL